MKTPFERFQELDELDDCGTWFSPEQDEEYNALWRQLTPEERHIMTQWWENPSAETHPRKDKEE